VAVQVAGRFVEHGPKRGDAAAYREIYRAVTSG
jgi:hypothetical protein